VRQHRTRPRWLPQPTDVLDGCRGELALIVERRRSLGS